ncbi:MAG: diaminopimelate epimerase [Planctomycetes bacterium]|nr:diaminopimelate epimerase [Planctomycetota bacterium]
MRFVKVEGAGNDYVLVDGFDGIPDDPAALSRAVSDRHRGIGSDGLIVLAAPGPGSLAHARMRMWNADGSEGRMCGNGLRCVVRWLVESGRASPDGVVRVDTAAGPREGRVLDGETVEVTMGVPDFRPEALPALLPGDGHDPCEHALPDGLAADPDVAFGVSIGNPHLVVRVSDPARVDLGRFGAALERSPELPEGANVHFTSGPRDGRVTVRPWERGSGATQACGTGAVAVAVVAMRLGWTPTGALLVQMPGGALGVRWDGRGPAWLAGPARLPFRGEWSAS